MKSISVLEFRQKLKSILTSVQKGQRIVLTYRGKPIANLEPIESKPVDSDDPFYRLDSLASKSGKSLTNTDMDRLIYGE